MSKGDLTEAEQEALKPGDVVHVIGREQTMVVRLVGKHVTQCEWFEGYTAKRAAFRTKTLRVTIQDGIDK